MGGRSRLATYCDSSTTGSDLSDTEGSNSDRLAPAKRSWKKVTHLEPKLPPPPNPSDTHPSSSSLTSSTDDRSGPAAVPTTIPIQSIREFLLYKGLSEAEVKEALKRVSA